MGERKSIWFRGNYGVAILVISSISLSGCGQPGQNQLVSSKPVLAIDPTDPCRVERTDFAKSKEYFKDQVLSDVGTGVVAGAVIGGVGAALLGVDPAKGALIGGGVGGLFGGANSYLKYRAEHAKDQAELDKSVNEDLTKEGQEIDHVTASFARVRACRFAQGTQIKTQVRARTLDRTTATQQLSFEKGWFAEEIKLARESKVSMEKRGQEFQEASDTIQKQATADAAAAAQAQAQAQAIQQSASKSNPDKRSGFAKNVDKAEAEAEIAFNIDNNRKIAARMSGMHG